MSMNKRDYKRAVDRLMLDTNATFATLIGELSCARYGMTQTHGACSDEVARMSELMQSLHTAWLAHAELRKDLDVDPYA